jgi:glycosyltransferase involved in cell wall biosynthesis
MRFRGFNVMQALRLEGVEVAHLDDRRIPERLAYALEFDLIVLVRRQMTPEIALVLDCAERMGIPVTYDLDDYLFDYEAIPCLKDNIKMFMNDFDKFIDSWRDVLLRCKYYTTTNQFLRERAAALGVRSYVIRNGLNASQIELSRMALEEASRTTRRVGLRLGYCSGSRTHQNDFRMIAGVLARLLEEFPDVGLVVSGDFDFGEFPEFVPFGGRVESRPFVDWRRIPSELARFEINLIPLENHDISEGRSNLKYFEAGVLKIPSVASPTQAYRSAIRHGINGLLASTREEWCDALRSLIIDPDLRRRLGDQAYEDVLRSYVPPVIAGEALSAYRDMLTHHRRNLGVADDMPTVVVVVSDLVAALRNRASAVALGVGLVQAGACVTLLAPGGPTPLTAAEAHQFLADQFPGAVPAVQLGGEVPCCDLLLATDPATALWAGRWAHRARRVAYFISEFEPVPLASGLQPEPVSRVSGLGMTLVTADSSGSEVLGGATGERLNTIPPWTGRTPLPIDVTHEPGSVLVAATSRVPPELWDQAVSALKRIHSAHPDVRIVLCGEAGDRGLASTPHEAIPRLSGARFEEWLAERPICLAVYPRIRPAWVYDMMAAGCPVVAASLVWNRRFPDTEATEGLISVPANPDAIEEAIDSLLIDRIRLSALAHRAAAHLAQVVEVREAARTLLDQLKLVDSPAAGHRDDAQSETTRSPLSIASQRQGLPNHRQHESLIDPHPASRWLEGS